MKKNESEDLKYPYLWVKCGILLATISDKSESGRSKQSKQSESDILFSVSASSCAVALGKE